MADRFILTAFCIGVVLSELGQWGKWKKAHSSDPWLDYWKVLGPMHILMNAGIDATVYCLWTAGLLDSMANFVLKFIPFLPDVYLTHGDIPLMPQVGLALGFGTDFFADPMAYTLSHIKIPWPLKASENKEKP